MKLFLVLVSAAVISGSAHAGLSDWIGGKINDAVSNPSPSSGAPITGNINSSPSSTGLSGTPRPASGVGSTASNDCDDLNDRLAKRLSQNVSAMAPKESPGEFVENGYGVNSLLKQVIPNGGFSFSSVFQSLTDSFLDQAGNIGRGLLSSKVNQIVGSVGGQFSGFSQASRNPVQQIFTNAAGQLVTQTTGQIATATGNAVAQAANQVTSEARSAVLPQQRPQMRPTAPQSSIYGQ